MRFSRSASYLAQIAFLAMAYYGAAKLGLSLTSSSWNAIPIWPSSGIALAALLAWGYRVWPGIALGALAAVASTGVPLAVASGMSLGNTCEALWGAYLLHRFTRFHSALNRVRHVVGLTILAAGFSTLVGASVSTASLYLSGIVARETLGSTWRAKWIGDAIGVLVITPLPLVWTTPPYPLWRARRLVEAGIGSAILALITWQMFGPLQGASPPTHSSTFFVFPFLIWAAIRFDQRGGTTVTLIVAAIAIWKTVQGTGPFNYGSLPVNDRLVSLQTFVATCAITSLTLAATIAERKRISAALIALNTTLEERVIERTIALHDVNTQLQRELAERKRVEEALQQHAQDLRERNEELNAFAYTVAHDLKNPLASIIGFAEALSTGRMTTSAEQAREFLGHIYWNAQRMNDIIEELLLLAQIPKQLVEMTPLDMAAIVAAAQQRLAHAIHESGCLITTPAEWPVALGYAPWIEEVWANYLSNAIQYGGRPPRVVLGATEQEDGMIRFWVRDNGPGLPPEAQAQLFAPFPRLSQAHGKGHGLGLAIVQRIVEKLGGQVGVESEVGQGSTFSFTLPSAAQLEGKPASLV